MLAYNADVPAGNPNERLAYIGQDLFASGFAMGQRIVNLVERRGGRAVHRHPRSAEHPAAHRRRHRRDQEVRQAGKIKTSAIATGSQLNDEIAKINAYYLGHKNVKGMFAVDAGSTQAVGQTVAKYGCGTRA